ncbi:MAG: alpha/beta hydrolase [Dermatophilaceae bacterium]
MEPTPLAPPFDPELAAMLDGVELPTTVTAEMLPFLRQGLPGDTPLEELLDTWDLEDRDVVIPGYLGDEIVVSVMQPRDLVGVGPGIVYAHGGGMVVGDRFGQLGLVVPWLTEHRAALVTVEYRLAPEFPDPYPVEDVFAGLAWTLDHAAELRIDPERLLLAGVSAGGGLVAGTALLARERGLPRVAGQLLMGPMLDDRDATVSTHQYERLGTWTRGLNAFGWTALLGDRRGTDDVSEFAAPARATDLSGLPPAYIDVGSAEVFRDEAVAYAEAIWQAGGSAELHVWSGGFHGFEGFAPQTAVAQASMAARQSWVGRVLGTLTGTAQAGPTGGRKVVGEHA